MGDAMTMRWPWKRKQEERQIARSVELAEMEDRNRDIRAKADELRRILEEISQRKRGLNVR